MSRVRGDARLLTRGVDGDTIAFMSALVAEERTPKMVVGWSLAAVAALLVLSVPMSLAGGVSSRPGVDSDALTSPLLGIAAVVGFTTAGMALVRLRPGNLLGWLLLVIGALHGVSIAGNAYGSRALTDPDGSLPLGLFATWLAACAVVPAFLLPTLVMPALYPTGRTSSRFWGWYVGACLVCILMLTTAAATVDGFSNHTVAGTGLPWDTPQWWAWATAGTGAALLVPAIGVVVIGTAGPRGAGKGA